ncbi:MAG TPA: 50S ribosome-binding GTPase [Thermotogota bacterium]|nr:50S ribosome-binding GTPase [Thermotogota bacterium]HPJ88714.1 50S ribosome-binding GTPase [Thermotogota bacterium]HPR95937.1 50S ribosome-binding GTPase [Thermotogota bacterium]
MKCHGCGVELQSEFPDKIGYIPEKSLIERANPICQRCYKIKHYGKNISPEVIHYTLSDLKQIANECHVTLIVVDLLDINGTWNENLRKAVGKNFVILLNKFDLIPKNISSAEITGWFSEVFSIPESKIIPVSSLNGFGIKKVLDVMEQSKKCCLAGATNVGKSTLLNKILKSQKSFNPKMDVDASTSSDFSGTTLGRVKRSLKNGVVIIDTPGVEISNRMMQYITPEDRHLIFNTDKLTRQTHKLESGKTIFFGGLCRIDILDNGTEKTPIFQIFSGHNIKYHKTSTEKADQIHTKLFGQVLQPPFREGSPSDYSWKTDIFELTTGQDLVISGLGWVNVKRGPLRISVKTPDNVSVEIRKAIFHKER